MPQLPRPTLALVSAVLLLSSCGTQSAPTAAASRTEAAPQMVQNQKAEPAAPREQVPPPAPPAVRLTTTPQTLKRAGAVFFFVGSADKSGKGLARTEVLIDGELFVNDPRHHNSYAKTFSAADNGKHTVKVILTDKAGLSSEVEQEFVVAVGE